MPPPTLDDAPTLERLLGDSLLAAEVTTDGKLSRADLIYIFDAGTQKVKTVTVGELGEAFGVAFS